VIFNRWSQVVFEFNAQQNIACDGRNHTSKQSQNNEPTYLLPKRSLHRLQLQRRSSTQPIQEYLTEVVIIIGDQNVDFFGFNLLPEPGCIIIYRFQRKI
jgi:hypothetical protein